MAYNLKITIYNNRDYEKVFTLNDSDGPRDLTGYSLVFSIGGPSTNIRHQSGQVGNKCIFFEDAASGQIKLVLPYEVISTLSGQYQHDCILISPTGKREGVWSGKMLVIKGVST